MSSTTSERKKITIRTIQLKKKRQRTIIMLTAYDYPSAQLVDQAEIDAILVGDSLGMVVLGYETTLPVTMDDMLHHCRAVARGSNYALLIGDMPFLSYQVSISEAVRNAGRFLQEAGMNAVKLEGGRERLETIQAIIHAGIPVMGHLGLTPQSVHQMGGYRSQGNTALSAKRLIEDAKMLEEAGCFSLVLESIPSQLASMISKRLSIPTIGIGAGNGCDGQVLVLHDMLGMYGCFKPKFAKIYADLNPIILEALTTYKKEVEEHTFPDANHSHEMAEEEWEKLLQLLDP